jgi:hypothetical protein
VGGIGFRIQDIEYKFCLAQQKFASELRYDILKTSMLTRKLARFWSLGTPTVF